MVYNTGSGGDGSGVNAMDCNKSSVFLESNDSLSGCAKCILGGLAWGVAFLKEKGLGKSKISPKRKVDFAFGNSFTGGMTGMIGDEDESAGWESSVSGAWGIFIFRVPWLDKLSSSLILPCFDESRGGVNTLPCSYKTACFAEILPCFNENWYFNWGELDRGLNLMLGALNGIGGGL